MLRYLISLFIIQFIIFCFQQQSEYTTLLYIGDKGVGKSCIICMEVLEHMNKGWNTYTDAHVSINGCKPIDPRILETHTVLPRSLVCVDEGKLCFDNRSYASWPKGLTEWFVLQRHYYSKVIICSQAVNVDKTIRDLSDRIVYITKLLGVFALMRPLEKTVKGNDDTSVNDNPMLKGYKFSFFLFWRLVYLPKYYKYNDSFAAPERPLVPGSLEEIVYELPFEKPDKEWILDSKDFFRHSIPYFIPNSNHIKKVPPGTFP